MTRQDHWEAVYGKKAPQDVSWYAPHLERSLALIEGTGVSLEARVIDIGGGASTLVDDLLERGYTAVSVLDIAESALEASKQRLGRAAARVTWLVGDITQVDLPPREYDVWHDRAVFHFLTEPAARRAYLERVRRSVKRGGHVILATFGPEGPEKCSGLPIVRYAPEALHAEFGAPFRLVSSSEERHRTPWGSEQEFVYCWCVKETDDAP